jgi:hypothetical protein
MTDIRQRVEEERGLIKKIQLFIPGFRGYRLREDLRAADNLLRIQLANALVSVEQRLNNVKTEMATNYRIKEMEILGALAFRIKELEGKIRHAEQGYSAIAAHLNVRPEEIDRLYEHDLILLEGIRALQAEAEKLPGLVYDEKSDLRGVILGMRRRVEEMAETFGKRMAVITRTEVV